MLPSRACTLSPAFCEIYSTHILSITLCEKNKSPYFYLQENTYNNWGVFMNQNSCLCSVYKYFWLCFSSLNLSLQEFYFAIFSGKFLFLFPHFTVIFCMYIFCMFYWFHYTCKKNIPQ